MTITSYLYSVRMLSTPKTFKIYSHAYLELSDSIGVNTFKNAFTCLVERCKIN